MKIILCVDADEIRNVELKIVEKEKRKKQRHGSEEDDLRVAVFAAAAAEGLKDQGVDENEKEEEVDEDDQGHELVDDIEKRSVVVLQNGLDVGIFDILRIPEFVDFGENLFPAVNGRVVAEGRHGWLFQFLLLLLACFDFSAGP